MNIFINAYEHVSGLWFTASDYPVLPSLSA